MKTLIIIIAIVSLAVYGCSEMSLDEINYYNITMIRQPEHGQFTSSQQNFKLIYTVEYPYLDRPFIMLYKSADYTFRYQLKNWYVNKCRYEYFIRSRFSGSPRTRP